MDQDKTPSPGLPGYETFTTQPMPAGPAPFVEIKIKPVDEELKRKRGRPRALPGAPKAVRRATKGRPPATPEAFMPSRVPALVAIYLEDMADKMAAGLSDANTVAKLRKWAKMLHELNDK